MKNVKLVFSISLLMLLTACATNVRTVNPSMNDLSNYETFAYLPNTNIDVEGKNYADTMVNNAIVKAVRYNLQNHGMELERDEPDLLVLISTSADVEIVRTSEPVYAAYPYQDGVGTISPYYDRYYYRGYASYNHVVGYNTSTYTYEEGTLVIDMIDRETKNTVWKGIATDEIYDQTTSTAIRKMVDDIFDEFPVKRENER